MYAKRLTTLAIMLAAGVGTAAQSQQNLKFTSRYSNNGETFHWKVFLDEAPDVLQKIKCVHYLLYPTLPNPSRYTCDGSNGFAIEENAKREFPIEIEVEWREASPSSQSYMLDLHSPDHLDKNLAIKPPPSCFTDRIEDHELAPFDIAQGPIYIYLAGLPLKFHGRADIVILAKGVWSGPRREVRSDDFKNRIAKLDPQAYGRATILSHSSSTVVVGGQAYLVKSDTSYQDRSAKITLCLAQ